MLNQHYSIIDSSNIKNAIIKVETEEALRIKKEKLFEKIKKLIRINIFDADDATFGDSVDYMLADWEPLLEAAEDNVIVQEYHPDIPIYNVCGFKITFVINWNAAFHSLHGWDYITNDMLNTWEMSIEELYQIAKKNMENLGDSTMIAPVESYELCAFSGTPVFRVYYDTPVFPQIGAGILFSSTIMNRLFDIFSDNFYIFPLEKNQLYVVAKNEIEVDKLYLLKNYIKRSASFNGPLLSEKIYVYDRFTQTITLLQSPMPI